VGLTTKTETEWSTLGAAFCGAVLASLAVMVHEVYTVIFGYCLSSDPFTHVLLEMAIFGPGGAILFGAIASVRNRFLADESSQADGRRSMAPCHATLVPPPDDESNCAPKASQRHGARGLG
jgi:hypothetical protein